MITKSAIFHGGSIHGAILSVRFDDAGNRIRDDVMHLPYARVDNCECGKDVEVHFRAISLPAQGIVTVSRSRSESI